MQLISGYLYKQNITVVKNSDYTPQTENQLVYAKPLQIYKGVDNRFSFLIKNNDQKPVSLLDSSVLFNLISPTSNELVFSRVLQLVYTAQGTATTLIEGNLLNDVSAGLYNYSMVVTNAEGEQQIVFSDDNYNAQGQARLLDSVYPEFVPSANLTVPVYTSDASTNYRNVAYTSTTISADRVKARAVYQTVQYNLNGFTGNIDIQASQDVLSVSNANNFVTVNSYVFNNATGNQYLNFQGKFTAVRFKVTQSYGNVNYILFRP